MNKKSLITAILLVIVVILSSTSVFAEDVSNDTQLQEVGEIYAVQEADTIDEVSQTDDNTLSSQQTIAAGSNSSAIQEKINSMSDGDVLNFENGTYTDICIYINKNITVNGNGATLIGYDTPSKENTPDIIYNSTSEGGYAIGNFATLYIVKTTGVTLNGLTIIGGANSASTYSNALVYAMNSHNMTFTNNILDGSSWGLYLQYCNDGKITNNKIKNQEVTGILNFGSARTLIEQNTITNAKNHGIDVRHGTGPNVQVINNTVIGSKEGIYLMHSKGHTAAYNTLINCTISSISCYGSQNINLYNNTMKKSRIGILLGGGYTNIVVGENTFQLDNLPFPPTFVYYVAEAKSDYQNAEDIMGTFSDSSTNTPNYIAYTGIDAPKDISIDYNSILEKTGTVYNVPEDYTNDQIQTMINSMSDGDTIVFYKNAVYENISIYADKNIKIIGNDATLIGYSNIDLSNIPEKVRKATSEGGYAVAYRAVLYIINSTGAVVSDLNILAQYPGYDTTKATTTTDEYKTVGIYADSNKNLTITGCDVTGASWGIFQQYSSNSVISKNNVHEIYTTGIMNFGSPNAIITENTISNAVNHGIDVRHGSGPNAIVFNNTISGAKEGIYLMHSKGHTVYNNTILNSKIASITCYGSGNEQLFNNTLSGSRIGILLGGGYYNVTIGENSYKLDSLPFPPTFVTYLARAENKYQSADDVMRTYSDKETVTINVNNVTVYETQGSLEITLIDQNNEVMQKQDVEVTIEEGIYTATTDSNGVAVIDFNLNNGTHIATVNYKGNDNYASATANATITVIITLTTGTAADIQNAIDNAIAGDIVDLTIFDSYEVLNNTITVNKDNLTIKGNGATTITGYGSGNGIFDIQAKYVTITGINFIDNNPKNNLTYGGSVNGWGVQFSGDYGASNGVIDNCTFKDFNQAVAITNSNYNTIKNSKFTGGIATLLINDPSVNKEQGSKVISVGGSFYTTIENNVFDGPVLDAISIAKASGDARIVGNQFINNAYAIFFGGASTDGTFITNNTFTNCGVFRDENRYYTGFPVISIEKAASGVYIDSNTFYVVNENMLIKGEQGNTAHGSPSNLGDINVTNNKVIALTDDLVGSSVVLFHINCKNSILNPYAPIYVTGNNLTKGVKALVVWSTEWGTEDSYNKKTGETITDIIVPKADLVKTQITDVAIANNGTIAGKLVDISGKAINAQTIEYTIDSVVSTVTTDKNGAFTINGVPGKEILISYAATDKYDATSFTTTLPAVQEDIETALTVSSVTVLAGNSGTLKITLKDANGTAIDGQKVTVLIDGVSKVANVVNGTASLAVKYTTSGTHYVTAYFAKEGYKPAVATSKITVNKKATTITAPAKSFKVAAVKKVAITLKSGKTPVAGKKVTITVGGKTFSAKTTSSGVATITVKLAKAGTFSYIAKFAGDGAYKATSKTGKIVVKK